MFEECLRREFRPDIVTEMTPAHDPLAYIPTGLTAEQARSREARIATATSSGRATRWCASSTAMNAYSDRGAVVFEYGNQIRRQCEEHGMADAMKIPGFVAAYLRPLFLEGRGPFRWTCTSGEPVRPRPA